MVEAERAPSAQAQSELPATQPDCSGSTPQGESRPHDETHPSRWKAPWLATLGATFGFLIGSGLYGEVHSEEQHFGEFLLIAIIIGTAAYWFFDPLMELIRGWLGAPPSELPKDRRIVTSLAVVVATLVIAILHHTLGESLTRFHPIGFLTLLALFAGTAGATTYYWVRGANQQPARSAAYGAKTGAIVGPVAGFLVVLLALQDKHLASQVSSQASFFAKGIGMWTFLTFVPGLLGGMAIEKSWDPRSPSRGILSCLGGFSAAVLLGAWVIGLEFADYKDMVWAIAVQALSQSVGWGLGLYLQREACDPALSPSWAAANVPPEKKRPSTVVVPIDTRKPERIELPADNRPVTPQVLLLQPKGSRLWALVVLVLALAIGAWGYATGIFRTDPEIVSEVDGKFEQDSGLHGRGLSAQSLQHVVTILGRVDNTVQHTAAVQQASGVRGVRQVVDQIQVAPPAPAAATAPKIMIVPPAVSVPAIQANISLFKSGPGSQAHPPKSAKGSTTSRPTEATKSGGFFHHLFGRNKDKKDKNKNNGH